LEKSSGAYRIESNRCYWRRKMIMRKLQLFADETFVGEFTDIGKMHKYVEHRRYDSKNNGVKYKAFSDGRLYYDYRYGGYILADMKELCDKPREARDD
jgi:hypothetical protein